SATPARGFTSTGSSAAAAALSGGAALGLPGAATGSTGAAAAAAGGVGGGAVQTGAPAAVPAGAGVPLSAFSHFETSTTTLSVNHQGQFPAVTISFNLAPGIALGDAVTAIDAAQREIGMPSTIQAGFQGTAQAFQASLANEPILILAA